jgi:thiol-disulfide isomerase/thioredoxin
MITEKHIYAEKGAIMSRLLVLAVCLLIMLSLVACREQTKKPNEPKEITPNAPPSTEEKTLAPDFTLKDLSGTDVGPASFRGKVLIIDFWATWCPPCRKAIPHLISMKQKYGDQGFEVLGVSMDEGPDAATSVKNFAQQQGVNYPMVIGNQDIANSYGGINGIPTFFIIDKNGYIIKSQTGYDEEVGQMMADEVEKLLSQ